MKLLGDSTFQGLFVRQAIGDFTAGGAGACRAAAAACRAAAVAGAGAHTVSIPPHLAIPVQLHP